jgi:hypothetical protein
MSSGFEVGINWVGEPDEENMLETMAGLFLQRRSTLSDTSPLCAVIEESFFLGDQVAINPSPTHPQNLSLMYSM